MAGPGRQRLQSSMMTTLSCLETNFVKQLQYIRIASNPTSQCKLMLVLHL